MVTSVGAGREAEDPLAAEISIGQLRLGGRVAVAPMTRTSATEGGCVTSQMLEYYKAFAEGGFPLVITEGTYVDESASQAYAYQPGIATEPQLHAWTPIVGAVHDAGSAIFLQLMHAGALVQHNPNAGGVAPSSLAPKGTQLAMHSGSGPYPEPRTLGTDEITVIIGAFADSARRARQAGFDGVEIHGANGYLVDQFLNPETNHRSDSYAGAVENRIRFGAEVVSAVRRAVGADYPVGIRISQKKINDPDHRWPGGLDDARIIFSALSAAGASYLHVSERDATGSAFETGETLARLARLHGGVPVIANGGLGDPEVARAVIGRGDADLVALGTAALANCDWPARVALGEPLVEFDPGMIDPLATLDNAADWRASRASMGGPL